MGVYSFIQICRYYGYGETITRQHINLLIEKKKFKKTSIGKAYNDKDLKALSELLGFELPEHVKKKFGSS